MSIEYTVYVDINGNQEIVETIVPDPVADFWDLYTERQVLEAILNKDSGNGTSTDYAQILLDWQLIQGI